MTLRLAVLMFLAIVPTFAQEQSVRCISPNEGGFRIYTQGQDGQIYSRTLYPSGDNVGLRPPATLIADFKTVVDAVVMMKGHVEIRTSTIILKADAAEYHVCTGEIVARGSVYMKPVATQ